MLWLLLRVDLNLTPCNSTLSARVQFSEDSGVLTAAVDTPIVRRPNLADVVIHLYAAGIDHLVAKLDASRPLDRIWLRREVYYLRRRFVHLDSCLLLVSLAVGVNGSQRVGRGLVRR